MLARLRNMANFLPIFAMVWNTFFPRLYFFYSLAAYGRRRKRFAQFDVKYRAFSTNWTAGPFVAKISDQFLQTFKKEGKYLYNILQISQILNCSPGADGESIVW